MKLFDSWPFYDKSLYENKWKNNKDYATIILNAIRIIKTTNPLDRNTSEREWIQHLKLEISKTSRLFVYVAKNKYYSCNFPFSVSKKDGRHIVRSESVEITDKLLSEIFGLLNDIGNSPFYNRYQDEEEETNYSDDAYQVLEKLITTEPGYVRYDVDAQNSKEHIHPKIHFDINMSKNSTFKVGIVEQMSVDDFESVFDKNFECFYLSRPSSLRFGLQRTEKRKSKNSNRRRK